MTGSRRAVAALLLTLLLVGSCGSDSTTNTAGSSQSATAVCSARDDLVQSLDALAAVDLRAGGTDALNQAMTDVTDAADALAKTVEKDLRDEVDAVQQAVDELKASVEAFDRQPSVSEAISAVTTAVTHLAEAAGALGEALTRECGGTSS